MQFKKFIYCFFLFLLPTLQAQKVFILVPGTWSSEASWYRPGGSFFDAFKRSAETAGSSIVTFVWSGENSHKARVKAAQKLAQLISCYDSVSLVTHSHGSNVGILASQFLPELQLRGKIDYFFALGTPVLATTYFPNMNVVAHFINFFSLFDKVQTFFGIFERTFPSHERIANIRVIIDNLPPTHSGIHDPVVGYWLPLISFMVEGNQFFFGQPGVVYFSTHARPVYASDYDQQTMVDLERETFNLAFTFRKKSHEKEI